VVTSRFQTTSISENNNPILLSLMVKQPQVQVSCSNY